MQREPDSILMSERVWKPIYRPWWKFWMWWTPKIGYVRDYAAEARNRADERARSTARLATLRAGPILPPSPTRKKVSKDESERRRLTPEPPEPPEPPPAVPMVDVTRFSDEMPRYAPKEEPPPRMPFRAGGAEDSFRGAGATGNWFDEKVPSPAPSPLVSQASAPSAAPPVQAEVSSPPPAPEPPPPPPPPPPASD